MTDLNRNLPGTYAPRGAAAGSVSSFMERGERNVTWLAIGFAVFAVASFTVLFIENANFDIGIFRGMFVPDTVNIARTFDDLTTLSGGMPFDPALVGTSLLFGWIWMIDPGLCVFLNLVMVLAAGIMITRISRRLSAPGWAVLGLFINPYLVLVAVAPNKEIPLILLGSLWTLLVLSKPAGWQASALLTAFCVYLFRDGFGASLAIMTIFLAAMGQRGRLLALCYLLLATALAAMFGILMRIIPILERNYTGYRQDFDAGSAVGNLAAAVNLDPLSFAGGIILYFFRMVYNALTMAVFPILTTEYGHSFWLGYSLWIFGLINLIVLSACVYCLVARNGDAGYKNRSVVAAIVFSTWCSISLSQFVQPRYLMPVLPIGFCLLSTLPSLIRRRLAISAGGLVVLVIGLYAIAGQAPLPAAIPVHEIPSFLWTSF